MASIPNATLRGTGRGGDGYGGSGHRTNGYDGQQAGTGLGRISDAGGKAWGSLPASAGGNAQSRPQKINEQRPKVFLKLGIKDSDKQLGTVVIELFGDIVPRTAENFRALCTGRCTGEGGKVLTYKKSPFHLIKPGVMAVGGDITNGNGSGGESIYGRSFNDESFQKRHTAPGIVSMVNRGPDSNSSMFRICSRAMESLDNKAVVVGEVVEGLDVFRKLESFGSSSGQPKHMVVINDCGEVESVFSRGKRRLIPDELPPGWEKKSSKSKPGVCYFVNLESKETSWHLPYGPAKRPRHTLESEQSSENPGGEKEETKPAVDALSRALRPGEIRVLHILRKHRASRPKPASWRNKNIQCSEDDAKEFMRNLHIKLHNTLVGGGLEALERKLRNIARVESDCDESHARGGELAPFGKGKLHKPFEKAAMALKKGELSKPVETDWGYHVILRLE